MENLTEIRCTHCHRLLAKGEARHIEFKCPRCGAYTIVRTASPDIASQRAPAMDYHACPAQSIPSTNS
ncbi:MAG: Com family DNA-binding transcriptional regulator [Desulfovibrionaceae bacterium]|nr:Com family DNA-binding transcriptional regulator [Desulfovibrionaceae bacterium]